MRICVLKNGAEEPEQIVQLILSSMRRLQEAKDISLLFAYSDLVKLASNPSYKMKSKYLEILQDRALLLQNGKMHDSVTNVILSLKDGSGKPVESIYEKANTDKASSAASSASEPTTSVAAASSTTSATDEVAPAASAATEVTQLTGDVEDTSLGYHA